MTPFDCQSMFLTVVGLLSLYQFEIGEGRSAHLDEFIEWLRRHDHDALADTILEHPLLAKSIESLMASGEGDLAPRLAALDKIIASVAAHVEGFAELSTAVRIDSQLSEQSVSVLRQLNDLAASAFIEYPLFGRAAPRYVTFGGMGGDLKIKDVRFIEDDIRTLVELGLLNEEQFNGHRGYRITRHGAAIGGDHRATAAFEPLQAASVGASPNRQQSQLNRTPR